jgi:hypothetical protein
METVKCNGKFCAGLAAKLLPEDSTLGKKGEEAIHQNFVLSKGKRCAAIYTAYSA